MHKLYLPFILLLLSLSLHAHDRVNKPLPTLGDTIGYLDSAKGWRLYTDGQWASKPNRIPLNASDDGESGIGADNFYYFLLQELKVGDSTYCILFKPFKHGFYVYPSIHEGWENDTNVC